MESVIKPGDKLHIATRRLFVEDLRRHFVGEVTSFADGLCKIQGHTFVFDAFKNTYTRNPEVRTRIFALGADGHIVNVLPAGLEIAALRYQMIQGRLNVTDDNDFTLEINEFGAKS